MQKPQYVSNLAACAIDPGIAIAAFTVGVYVYCGFVLAAGA